MSKIKVIIIKPGTIEEKEIDDDLKTMYGIIHCDTIDIVSRKIHKKTFSFVCDDEALLKEAPKICASSYYTCENLYGTIIIAKPDGEELKSLNEEDIRLIRKNYLTPYGRYGVLIYD